MSVKYAGIANNAVKHAFKEASFKVVKGSKWNVCWGNILEAEEYGKLHEFQRVNHFPGSVNRNSNCGCIIILLEELL
jgi:tubulin polyglutamylase TTLL4